jgi:predicted nucleic acid binding AN1-type Zn finger protein
MGICSYCSAIETMPFKCKFCGEEFCGNHRLPENHECIGLMKFKEGRSREPEKWIYEPFQEKHKVKIGREVREQPYDRIYKALREMDSRMVLYIILVTIIILSFYRAII